MAITLAIFSALVIAVSFYGIICPPNILVLAKSFTVGPGIWTATGIRLLLAVLLWFTSPVCQTPAVFRVLAALVFVAAVALPAMGTGRLKRFVEWHQSWPTFVVRLQGLVGIGLGGFLMWSIWPAVAA